MKKITLLFLSFAFSIASFAEIQMPKIFSDNMLLQRHAYVKIWGKADANAKVDVEFAGQQKSAKADAKGNWSLRLDKMPANKNPQEMKISENGKLGKTIKNILVGEVWIAGGQSNMQWPVRRSQDAKKNIAEAKELGNTWLSPNLAKNDTASIQLAVDNGIGLSFWTVNTIEDAKMLYDMGVRYMETDTLCY